MSTVPPGVSRAFSMFGTEAPAHAAAWMEATHTLAAANALDAKTTDLAYVAGNRVIGRSGRESWQVLEGLPPRYRCGTNPAQMRVASASSVARFKSSSTCVMPSGRGASADWRDTRNA